MGKIDYIEALKNLLQELQQITIEAMASTGVKSTSDLSKSVKYTLTKDGIKMEVAEYYPYVSEGHLIKRRAGLRKVPIDVLIQWIKKNNIIPNAGKTINQLAWAIQTSIYKKGIRGNKKTKGRKFADKVANNVADYTAEELADVLANEIADELVDMFEPVVA